ncbi:hypothetical protein HJFPF1_01524 [Paramyrothecium foliicola]|nr:hypothetical protein HJFPF1_01524 [Paramyrothecium foliicola]
MVVIVVRSRNAMLATEDGNHAQDERKRDREGERSFIITTPSSMTGQLRLGPDSFSWPRQRHGSGNGKGSYAGPAHTSAVRQPSLILKAASMVG